jgi:uncharacterized protein YgbK (DUF1537 family)
MARALAARLGLLPERAELPSGRRWLIVAGSVQPATRRQIKEARAAGLTVLATPERRVADPADAIVRLAAQAAAAIEKERWDLVAVTGGETAVALWVALGADRLDLVGVPASGLALGHLRVRGREPLALLTKAGGFGRPDLFVSLQKEASREPAVLGVTMGDPPAWAPRSSRVPAPSSVRAACGRSCSAPPPRCARRWRSSAHR